MFYDYNKCINKNCLFNFIVGERGNGKTYGYKKIALENMYLLSQHMTYVRYTGSNIKRRRSGANYIEYNVDGIPVMCFDKSTSFESGIISIMQERSIPCLYLQPYTE